MPNKLLQGHEIEIKVRPDELRTRTIPQLSHEFYGDALRATEYRAKAMLGGFAGFVTAVLAVGFHVIFALLTAYCIHVALKNQYKYGYLQGAIDDRGSKKYVRIDK